MISSALAHQSSYGVYKFVAAAATLVSAASGVAPLTVDICAAGDAGAMFISRVTEVGWGVLVAVSVVWLRRLPARWWPA